MTVIWLLLTVILCYYGGIGRHYGLKIHWSKIRTGSSPVSSTKKFILGYSQEVRQQILTLPFTGSNPVIPTKAPNGDNLHFISFHAIITLLFKQPDF